MISSVNSNFNNMRYSLNNKGTQKADSTPIDDIELPGTKRLNLPPAVVAGVNAAFWYGIGTFTLPRLLHMNKNVARIISAAVGTAMAVTSYKYAKNNTKQA